FRLLLDSLNPERILIASETIGVGKRAVDLAAKYASEREVFGRKIGANQSIQHPLAESWMALEAADLMVWHAARSYDNGRNCGAEANAAKYLAAEAAFEACDRALRTHGGVGYAKEYNIERYLREVMLMRIAPISREMILCYIAEKVLGLPRSY
ncbi:MAG: acyl-CoA dehydrogenase family protein, partial [Betaproteobacteria bacterium]